MTSSPDKEAIGREASDWLLRLADDPDDADMRRRFEAWLAHSPAHATAWADTVRAYDLFGAVAPRHASIWRARAGSRRWRDKRRWPRRLPARGAVLAVACAALVMLAIGPSLLLRMRADAVTGAGETRTLTLADGSEVRLAPRSAITANMSGGERRVRLLTGEAWFDVRGDAARPFIVSADGTETRVLGTAFDIRIDGASTTVAVERGKVRVTPEQDGTAAVSLLPGDWVAMTASGSRGRGRMPGEDVAATVRGEILADKRSIRDVVGALRPWYSGYIILAGDRIAGRTVTGIYDARDPEAVLNALAATQGGVVHQVTPWIIILSDR